MWVFALRSGEDKTDNGQKVLKLCSIHELSLWTKRTVCVLNLNFSFLKKMVVTEPLTGTRELLWRWLFYLVTTLHYLFQKWEVQVQDTDSPFQRESSYIIYETNEHHISLMWNMGKQPHLAFKSLVIQASHNFWAWDCRYKKCKKKIKKKKTIPVFLLCLLHPWISNLNCNHTSVFVDYHVW